MKRSDKYVALDVHRATTVTAVREADGRVIARTMLPTEAGSMVAYFGRVRGTIRVTCDELSDLLRCGQFRAVYSRC